MSGKKDKLRRRLAARLAEAEGLPQTDYETVTNEVTTEGGIFTFHREQRITKPCAKLIAKRLKKDGL